MKMNLCKIVAVAPMASDGEGDSRPSKRQKIKVDQEKCDLGLAAYYFDEDDIYNDYPIFTSNSDQKQLWGMLNYGIEGWCVFLQEQWNYLHQKKNKLILRNL